MKKSFTLFLAMLTAISIFSQAPDKMSYQAVIRNGSNQLVVSNTVGMRISILQGSAEGTVVYTETQTPTTNANGLVSIEIGGGEGFSSIDWSSGTYFIKTETDPLGGSSYTIMGTSQLLSVPYALNAKTAENISGTINYDETDPVFSSSEAANVTSNDITKLSKLSGTNSGDQDLSDYATKSALGDSTALVRSEIPDISGLLSSETDPLYTSSPSADITDQDIINLGNLSGVNTGDQDLSNLVRMHQLIDSLTIIRSEIPDVSGYISTESDPVYSFSASSNITDSGSGRVISDAERTKLQNIVVGAEVNVQADWNETNNTLDSYILNKPSLATVASTGEYNDLSNRPAIDGSETKINAGDNINVSGTGTAADPYLVSSSTGAGAHYIGEFYGGGIVFYTWANGQHGLIVSLNYLSAGTDWSNANTLCINYSNHGYNDWYLPSAEELKLLLNNSFIVNKIIDNDGDPTTTIITNNEIHWSSTQASFSQAFACNYNNFVITNFFVANKDGWYDVRAVREF